jgi:four helix bundle protein
MESVVKGGHMAFKFENLEVWRLALDHVDDVYRLAVQLPKEETYNLRSQWIRAATSVTLNIAEGSTGQTDQEQVRFLGYVIRSLVESIACFRLAQRRGYVTGGQENLGLELRTEKLIRKLQSFRNAIRGNPILPIREKTMVHRPMSIVCNSSSKVK